ncbi:MAG: hypothetical protein K9I94_11000 [Bacteroidales bacterium]|nr:hypothetical protein [Bacteroidales bacterium]
MLLKIALLATVVLCFMSLSSFSQDLVVTNQGDSINCDIKEIKFDYFYFTYTTNGVPQDTSLPAGKVSFYKYKYYGKVKKEKTRVNDPEVEKSKVLRFALEGGYSQRLAKISEGISGEMKQYIRQLKSGYHIGGQISYYITSEIALGARASLFQSSNRVDNVYIEDTQGNRRYGEMSDEISIIYLGPSFLATIPNKHHSPNAFTACFSLGYIGYYDRGMMIYPVDINGNTIGLTYEIGYDIKIDKNFMLGLNASVIAGILTKYDLRYGTATQTVELEEDQYEGLTRLDFSIGIRLIN